jgi:hypothetical protein
VAKAKLADLKRTSLTFSYNLAYGNPDLIPEMTFLFDGLKEQIDEIYWLGTRITHSIDASNGFTTALELEVFCPDVDDVSELFEDQFELEKDKKWTGVVVYYQSGNKAVALTKGINLTQAFHLFVCEQRSSSSAIRSRVCIARSRNR